MDTNNFDEFDPHALSNIIWGFATNNYSNHHWFEAVGNHISRCRNLNDFDPQHLSMIVWGFATINYLHYELFESVGNHISQCRNLDDFNPQAISNTIWAFAKINYSHYKLFESVGNHIAHHRSLDDFNSQAINNTVWAFARVDISHNELFESVGNHIAHHRSLDDFNPQAISITVWAFAKRGYRHNTLFEKVANHIIEQNDLLTVFEGQSISLIIRAFSMVQADYPEMFETLTNNILQRDELDDFSFLSLIDIVWGLNQFTTPPRELMDKVLQAAIERSKRKEHDECNEIEELARLSKEMFPVEKEICMIPSCDCCEKIHINNNIKLLEVILRRRLERNYDICVEEGEAIADEDISEEQPPSASARPPALPDEQQLQQEIDEMKKKVDLFLGGKDQDREKARQEMSHPDFSKLSDAEKAQLTAQMNGVSEPERKGDGENPTDHGFSELQYEWLRYKLIITLIISEDAAQVPLFTEQCVRVLLFVSPEDLHVLWVNHCATQFDGAKGHCNLHCGNGCREGYNMLNCASVVAMVEIAKYFERYTAIKFGDVVEHVQCVNLCEFCPTEGRQFQRCPVGRESQTNPLVGIFNLFLQALSDLKVHTIVASSAGKTCGVEELVLNKLERASDYITIIRKTLWHLQFNMVQHEAKSPEDMGRIMTKQWEIFSRFMMSSLKNAGISSATETILEYMKNNENMIFVTDDPTQLEGKFLSYFSTKEERIQSLLQACMTVCPDAKVKDQVLIIQRYAQNHWSEIQKRLGWKKAPNSWHYLTVREILTNMRRNGGKIGGKNGGKIGGKNSWAARLERFDPEEVTKQMSNMGTKSSGNVVRQVEAEEKQHKLSLLAKSGEPFWIRAKKGDITANEGDLMCRSHEGKTHHNFTTIQVRHGEYVSVDELRYLDCPFVNNEVVDISYYTMHVDYPIKGYSLKVPYGMVSKSNENGNALLMWYEKKAQ